jgi:hypothetical protein
MGWIGQKLPQNGASDPAKAVDHNPNWPCHVLSDLS